jgi:hypothetical protein
MGSFTFTSPKGGFPFIGSWFGLWEVGIKRKILEPIYEDDILPAGMQPVSLLGFAITSKGEVVPVLLAEQNAMKATGGVEE